MDKPVSAESMRKHTHRGSQVVNLLGKVEAKQEREGAQTFTLKTEVCSLSFIGRPGGGSPIEPFGPELS